MLVRETNRQRVIFKFHFAICNCELPHLPYSQTWIWRKREVVRYWMHLSKYVWHAFKVVKLNVRCVYLSWCYTGPGPQPAAHPPVQCRPAPPFRPGERKEMHFWCSLGRIISLCCNFLYFRVKLQLLVAIAEMLRKYLF